MTLLISASLPPKDKCCLFHGTSLLLHLSRTPITSLNSVCLQVVGLNRWWQLLHLTAHNICQIINTMLNTNTEHINLGSFSSLIQHQKLVILLLDVRVYLFQPMLLQLILFILSLEQDVEEAIVDRFLSSLQVKDEQWIVPRLRIAEI